MFNICDLSKEEEKEEAVIKETALLTTQRFLFQRFSKIFHVLFAKLYTN